MGVLRGIASFIGRWANYAAVMRMQRWSGFGKGTTIYDPLLDPDAQRAARVPASAHDAEWPPRPRRPRARKADAPRIQDKQ